MVTQNALSEMVCSCILPAVTSAAAHENWLRQRSLRNGLRSFSTLMAWREVSLHSIQGGASLQPPVWHIYFALPPWHPKAAHHQRWAGAASLCDAGVKGYLLSVLSVMSSTGCEAAACALQVTKPKTAKAKTPKKTPAAKKVKAAKKPAAPKAEGECLELLPTLACACQSPRSV